MSFRFLLPLLLASSAVFSTPVEVSHPVAGFLRRLEEKGLIRPGFWNTLPRSEAEVASALEQARQKESSLTAWDRRRLERYLNEFDPARRTTRLRYRDSLFSVRGRIELFLSGSRRDSLPRAEYYASGGLTPGVDATYGEKTYFTASALIGGMERNESDRFVAHYDPQRGLPYNTNRAGQSGTPQGVSTFDGFRTVLGFGDAHVKLEAGQDWNQWGPGQWQHATLGARPWIWASDSLPPSGAGSQIGFNGSDTTFMRARRGYRYPGEGPPLPQIRLRIGGDRWEYSKIVARRMGLTKESSAYLVAHRLQFRLGDWKFAGTEMLVVGDRSLDELSLVPGIPLKMLEHSSGDQDNSAMAADVEWTWRGRGRVYGELFLDDFSGPPLNFWGNKFAWVLGASFQDPFGLPSEVHLEYAHVDPWVYGHHLENTSMQSYGALLGSSLPPNSHAVIASASFPLPLGLEGVAEWHFRQRDLKSHGSSIFEDFYLNVPPADTKEFLARDVETRNEFLLSGELNWDRYLRFRGGVGALWVDNWRGHAGESLVTPSLFGELYLRY
ncbi:MAG: putative lipoprotein [Fibrobacteria bacterium]|jgi:hypothetical protein|nr:putative lipoprotein [Fibrobacteria bacterium]